MQLPAVAALLEKVLPGLEGNVVLDAFALSYLSEDAGRLQELPARYVLTPNEEELLLTLGVDPTEMGEETRVAAGRLAALSGLWSRPGARRPGRRRPRVSCGATTAADPVSVSPGPVTSSPASS